MIKVGRMNEAKEDAPGYFDLYDRLENGDIVIGTKGKNKGKLYKVCLAKKGKPTIISLSPWYDGEWMNPESCDRAWFKECGYELATKQEIKNAGINESVRIDESTSSKWVQVDLNASDDYKYCGNGGRSWVTADSKNIDTWDSKEAAIANGKQSYKRNYKYGRDWDVVKLEGSVEMNESSSDKDFEDFKRRCQANPTYKKASAIANKYGYRLAPLCYVEVTKSGKKLVNFNVAAADRNSYHPEIYFSSKLGKDPDFEIQTTAYGAMNLSEHSNFIKGVTDAHKMVAELSKLDLTTLEATNMED